MINASKSSSFSIQNKVFGHQGEQVRWSQLKSYRSQSAVTRYIRKWLLPLGQNDNYRIAVSRKSGISGNSLQYLSIDDWFELRESKSLRTTGNHA